MAFITFYILLWIAGGNDFVATIFEIPVNWITWFMRIAVIVLPPVMYVVDQAGLHRPAATRPRQGAARPRDRRDHGQPGRRVLEVHAPISQVAAYELTAHRRQAPVQLEPETDENGIPAPRRRVEKVRARLSSFYFGDVVQKPTTHELEAARTMTGTATGMAELDEAIEPPGEHSGDRYRPAALAAVPGAAVEPSQIPRHER